jgi:large subunit ribosomal protein L6
MKIKEFKEEINFPEGVSFEVLVRTLKVLGKNGECIKEFKMPRFIFLKEGNNLAIKCKDYNFYDKRNFLTIKAHVNNMIKGVQEGFEYKLKICSSHFPMNVSVSGNKLIVKNLLGEKVPRELLLKTGVNVKIEGTEINVSGADIEKVSTVASDIEQLTRNTDRDRRIFQDGIYITHKAGKEI